MELISLFIIPGPSGPNNLEMVLKRNGCPFTTQGEGSIAGPVGVCAATNKLMVELLVSGHVVKKIEKSPLPDSSIEV